MKRCDCIYSMYAVCVAALFCPPQVLWDLIKEEGADQDGDNRISEEEFVRPFHARLGG